jgi:hypothetical protein
MKFPLLPGLLLTALNVFPTGTFFGAESLDEIEQKIEKAIVTDSDMGSFAGLLKAFANTTDEWKAANALSAPEQITKLNEEGHYAGIVQLALAIREKDPQKVSEADINRLSLVTFSRLSEQDVALGLGNPILLYWRYYSDWPVVAGQFSALSTYFTPYTQSIIMKQMPANVLGDLIRSDSFATLSFSLRAAMLQHAHQEKIIDLTANDWQATLKQLSQDPHGGGGYVYLLFAKDRQGDFLSFLKDYIVKFDNRPELIAGVGIAAAKELGQIDIINLPIKDQDKKMLITAANGGMKR